MSLFCVLVCHGILCYIYLQSTHFVVTSMWVCQMDCIIHTYATYRLHLILFFFSKKLSLITKIVELEICIRQISVLKFFKRKIQIAFNEALNARNYLLVDGIMSLIKNQIHRFLIVCSAAAATQIFHSETVNIKSIFKKVEIC